MVHSGNYSEETVKDIQNVIGADSDGIWGPKTVDAICAWHEKHKDLDQYLEFHAVWGKDSSGLGYNTLTIESIQRVIGAHQDGIWGPKTVKHISAWRRLNTESAFKAFEIAWNSVDIAEPRDVESLCTFENRAILIDTSYHQGSVNWTAVKRTGVHGVIHKATEGRTYTDPKFSFNYKATLSEGFLLGGYHVGRPVFKGKKTSAAGGAKNFLDAFLSRGWELPALGMWLDLEAKYIEESNSLFGVSYTISWIKTFLGELDKAGAKSGLYWTSRIFKKGSDLYIGKAADCFKEYMQWWPYYPKNLSVPLPFIPPRHEEGWSWDLWQFTSTGVCSGINGDIDINVFNGNLKDLKALFNL